MCRTRRCGAGVPFALVFVLGAGAFVSWARGQEAAPAIPRDQFGAAEVEYQQELFSKLVPTQDLAELIAPFDPVVWKAHLPADNELTPERVALGRKLYFDKRLSADGTQSCATCHDVTRGFTDQRPVAEGIGGQLGMRNSPTVLNTALLQTMFWDGRSPSLDHQATQPILNPIEMGMPDEATALKAISGDAEYQQAFQAAYGREMNYQDLGRAIGAFERTLIFLDSPFRRFLGGERDAISAEARAGWDLFNGKARCVACHPMNPSNPLGTDNRFHNIGVSAHHQDFESLARQALVALAEDSSEQALDELAIGTDLSELGRFMVTRNRADIGSFRTPLLLNIGITGPYMHDGSLATLWDVMDHYNKGGEPNLYLDGGIEPLGLTETEIDQVVAFLFTLTDSRLAADNEAQLAQQQARAKQERPSRDQDLVERNIFPFERRVTGSTQPNTEQ